MDREGPIHRAIVSWLRVVLPDAVTATVKNEINKRGKAIQIEIAKAKANGVMPGFPDIICLPGSDMPTMFFEVKAPGGYPSQSQKDVHARLTALGYRVAVVRSIDDVKDRLAEWGVQTREIGSLVEIPHRGTIR